ncbi:MAG: DNA-directed RNA polymerase subunit alpha [Candidatus Kapaibacteriales bacterium]
MNTHIQMPEKVNVEKGSETNYGRYTLQPLEQGFGVTLGNAMRRVLLSSIPGSAIVGVKISDVLHEFQTLEGVIEDVASIILNLKQVRLKQNDKENNRLTFTISGPKIFTAGDIEENTSGVEIINKDQYICEITADIELEFELRLGQGTGYVPSEEHQINDFPVGMLPIDTIFTPIKNVVYNIEPFRVGQKTDYEKLILEVQTDGTVGVKESVHFASQILNEHFKLFYSVPELATEDGASVDGEDSQKESERQRIRKILITPVEELELSVRAHNCLKAAEINSLGELVKLEESELLKFRNFGKKSLTELGEVVLQNGLEFGMNVDYYLKDDKPAAPYLQ